MSRIHPLAFVDPNARIGRDVDIGPFCHVGPHVSLGDNCRLHPHCTLLGPAEIGPHNEFYPQSTIGAAPQDLKYRGGPTLLHIGAHNVFRELTTVHRGTEIDTGITRIGDHNLLMVGVHIAHDVVIADHVIIANGVQVAGHCRIEERVNIGGLCAMHHFVTVGRYAYVGGMTGMRADIPPYMKCSGWNAEVRGFNAEGMRRWKLPEPSIDAMKRAYKILYAGRREDSAGRTVQALAEIDASPLAADPHVAYLVQFLRRQLAASTHGRHLETRRRDTDDDRRRFYAAPSGESAA